MQQCHGWQRAAMFRMNGQTLCSRDSVCTVLITLIHERKQSLSTYIHVGNGNEQRCLANKKVRMSNENIYDCCDGGKPSDR